MPGLLGIASARGLDELNDRFTRAADRMMRRGRLNTTRAAVADPSCVVARFTLSAASQQLPPTAEAAGHALLHGVVYNQTELRKSLDGSSAAGATTDDDLVAALYTHRGPDFVNELRGEFAVAVVDSSRRQLLLATDTVASYPLYWRVDAGGLIFSSDLSALLSATPDVRHLDMSAVADYVTVGAVFGDKTLAKGVQVLSPGTTLIYDFQTNAVSVKKYVELATFFEPVATDRERYLDDVQAAFVGAVDRSLTGTQQFGLSLSGGLDSRAILSATNGRSSSLRTYTLGVAGCADQVIASKLSHIAGTQHSFFELDRSYLRDFLPNMARMVSITDGMYLSHGLTEMLAIQFLDRTGIEVLLRGHGGELAKAHLAWPLHTDAQVYQLKSSDEVARYLSRRANYITPGLALNGFLAPEAAAAAGEGSVSSIAEALRGHDLSPAAACSYLYLRELNRRFTVPSLELFRTRVDVRLPFVDRDFLRVLLAAPPEWRDNTAIHQKLTAAGIPRLLKVRNSNTGAPANAGPRSEFVLDKMNTVLKRLHVYGYRHYHNFDEWMRGMLLESVQAELLAPGARVQAFLAPGALERLIRETRTGQADHGYLLQVLVILELWQRENNIEAAA
jgi:asparagine synthase (glutamine-hydrolysing)